LNHCRTHCQNTATHCKQYTATPCNTTATRLQQHCNTPGAHSTLQHSATRNTLQDSATTLQHTNCEINWGIAFDFSTTLQHTHTVHTHCILHCNNTATTLQHTHTVHKHCILHTHSVYYTATYCSKLRHNATHCNNTATTLQHTWRVLNLGIALDLSTTMTLGYSPAQITACVAVCCSVLHCVAVCRSVL